MDPVQNQITNENSPKQKDALRTSISMKLPDFEGETRHTSFLKAVCRLLREPWYAFSRMAGLNMCDLRILVS